jgi:hypothetical protein
MIESLLPNNRKAQVEYDIQKDHESTQNMLKGREYVQGVELELGLEDDTRRQRSRSQDTKWHEVFVQKQQW